MAAQGSFSIWIMSGSVLVPEVFAEVFLRAVAENRHDGRGLSAFGDFARQQGGRVHVAARRNTDQQSLFASQAAHHLIRVFCLDPEIAVRHRVVVESRADRRRYVLETFKSMEAARRLRRIALYVGQIA